jgi:hypothetical protein
MATINALNWKKKQKRLIQVPIQISPHFFKSCQIPPYEETSNSSMQVV